MFDAPCSLEASGKPAQEPGLKKAIIRFLSAALEPRPAVRKTPRLKDIAPIRNHMLRTIEDCNSAQAHRLRMQIEGAGSPQELWLLRNDAFQLISQQHSQQVAAERINGLIQVFEGWLDPKQLVRIL